MSWAKRFQFGPLIMNDHLIKDVLKIEKSSLGNRKALNGCLLL